jgi:hypothetical protein
MVTFQQYNKFYSRNSNGKYLLDISEIRNLFALSESAIQRIGTFVMNVWKKLGQENHQYP